MRSGSKIPDKFSNAPTVPLGMDLYMDAFWDLTDMRQVGWGSIGPIGWLPVMEYARAIELSDEQTEDLVYYVRALDHEYLSYRKREIDRGN